MKNGLRMIVLCALVGLLFEAPAYGQFREDMSDKEIRTRMRQINEYLSKQGADLAIAEVEFFTIGLGRPDDNDPLGRVVRIHQQGSRWVPADPRRLADGNNITYLVDPSRGATPSGLSVGETEAAIDRSLATWNQNRCLKKIEIIKQPAPLDDTTILDDIPEAFGGFCNQADDNTRGGFPFYADTVHAGWYPNECFGFETLAFTVSFVFLDIFGNPTDIDGNNYTDTALKEIYFNDAWGNPTLLPLPGGDPDPRASFPWGIDVDLPGIDVETVSLHENGHALELGHFGPPPAALMNPVISGLQQSTRPIDNAGMCAVWRSWPK